VHVVVTRERGMNDTLISWLPDTATVYEVPLTTTRYFDADEVQVMLRVDEHYGDYRALVVSSARSVRYVDIAREALSEGGITLSVGSATSRALERENVDVDVVGHGGAADLALAINEGPVLLLGAAAMRDDLSEALEAKGIEATQLACYETVPEDLGVYDVKILRKADVIFIGAPSAWLVAGAHVPEHAWVIVPGATTGDIVRRQHQWVIEGWGPGLREQLSAL
jgi:uroporphyrinogen-III synthase